MDRLDNKWFKLTIYAFELLPVILALYAVFFNWAAARGMIGSCDYKKHPDMGFAYQMLGVSGIVGGVLSALVASDFISRHALAGCFGCLVAFAAGYFLTVSVYTALTRLRIRYFVSLPPCRNGESRVFGRDYKFRRGTVCGWIAPKIYNFSCRCGDQYWRLDRRFMLQDSDGNLVPYAKLTKDNKWATDKGDDEADS